MGDGGSKTSLIKVSDVFGIGKLADSKAAERLVGAVIAGIGRLAGPALLRKEFKTQIELQKLAEQELSEAFSGEISLSDRAITNLRFKTLRGQQNREQVATLAIEDMRSQEPLENSGEMDLDWLDRFWSYAEGISDNEMQAIWAKVLSGEARRPNSMSYRLIDALRSLSRNEAREIERISSVTVCVYTESGQIFSNNFGLLDGLGAVKPTGRQPGKDRISELSKKLTSQTRSRLEIQLASTGLWTLDGWGRDYRPRKFSESVPISIGNRRFRLNGFRIENPKLTFKEQYLGSGLGLSFLGLELVRLADMPPDNDYVDILRQSYSEFGLELREEA